MKTARPTFADLLQSVPAIPLLVRQPASASRAPQRNLSDSIAAAPLGGKIILEAA